MDTANNVETTAPPAPPADSAAVEKSAGGGEGEGGVAVGPKPAGTARRNHTPRSAPKRGRRVDMAVMEDEDINPLIVANAAVLHPFLDDLQRGAEMHGVPLGSAPKEHTEAPSSHDVHSQERQPRMDRPADRSVVGDTASFTLRQSYQQHPETQMIRMLNPRLSLPRLTNEGQQMRLYCKTELISWEVFESLAVPKSDASAVAVDSDSSATASPKEPGDYTPPTLTASQEESVNHALKEVEQGKRQIDFPLPFVSAFISMHAPQLGALVRNAPLTGSTFLILGVVLGNEELCKRCLQLGADPNSTRFLAVPDDDNVIPRECMRHGYTPTFLAVICRRLSVIQLLTSFGGNLFVLDRYGRTPMHAAVYGGDLTIIKWLLAHGCPCRVRDVTFATADMCIKDDAWKTNKEKEEWSASVPPELWTQSPLENDAALNAIRCSAMDALPSTSSEEPSEAAKPNDAKESHVGSGASGNAEWRLCHCGSGRCVMRCGCVDDMTMRWSLDRIRSWIPVKESLAKQVLAAAAAAEAESTTAFAAMNER